MPNGRCRMHGGKSLSGLEAPGWKTGRYSKHLPSRLAARYQESLDDQNLLELREEIALTDARIEDLLTRVDTGEAGRKWQQMRSLLDQMQAADSAKRQHYLGEIFAIIRGRDDYAAWDEVHKLIAQRQRLSESERKRILDAQQYLTTQQAMALIGAILAVIRENVDDTGTLRAISRGIDALIAADNGG